MKEQSGCRKLVNQPRLKRGVRKDIASSSLASRTTYFSEIKKVLGPYKNKKGKDRKFVILSFKDGTNRSITYAKWLLENKLQRKLERWETVDHINRDCTDDRIENLQILDKKTHTSIDHIRIKVSNLKCDWCNKELILEGKKAHDAFWNRQKNKVGPFCGRSCAGKYGKSIQMGAKKLEIKSIEKEYFYKDKV